MPIFEYKCAKCANSFELLTSGGTSEPVKCPKCSSSKVIRVFSSFSVGRGGSRSPSEGGTSGACSTCTTGNCSSCG